MNFLKTLFFSGTGNCLYVAKEIGGEVLNISELLWSDEYEIEDDVVGFVFPSYYYGVPRIVERYMDAMQVKANYIFVIVTYGSVDGDTFGDCKRILKKRGLKQIILITFVWLIIIYLSLIWKMRLKLRMI